MDTEIPISVSERARAHIRAQLELTESELLRLGLKESGCNGYMYTLDFLIEPAAGDHCYDVAEGVRICVNDEDLPFVTGTEVDMVTEGLNSALVFKNPQAQSYCGCGESFAFGDAGGSAALDPAGLATDAGARAGRGAD